MTMPEPRTSRKRKTVNYTESLEPDEANATTPKGKSKRKSKFAEDEDSDDFMEDLPKNRKPSQEGSSQECKGGRRSKSKAENKPANTRAALSLAERREKAEIQQAIELSKSLTKATDAAEGNGNQLPLADGTVSDTEPNRPEPEQTRKSRNNHDTNLETEASEASNGDNEIKPNVAQTTQNIAEGHASESAAEPGLESARNAVPATDKATSNKYFKKEKENRSPKVTVKRAGNCRDGSDDGSAYDEDLEEEEHEDDDEISSDESAFEPEETFKPPAKSKSKAKVKEVAVNAKQKPKTVLPKAPFKKTTATVKAAPAKPAVKPSQSVPPPRIARSSNTSLGGLGMLKGSATYRVGLSKRHKSAAPLHPYLKAGSSSDQGTPETKGAKKR